MSSHFLGSIVVALKDKYLDNNFPSPPFYFSFYCWAWYYMVQNISSVNWVQLSQLCLFPPSGRCCGGCVWRGSLDETSSTVAKTLVCYQCSSYKYKAQHSKGYGFGFSLKPKSWHSQNFPGFHPKSITLSHTSYILYTV